MIESIHHKLIKQYGPGIGIAATLGDQHPSNATGFDSTKKLFSALGYSDFIDIDYNGKAGIFHDLNFPMSKEHHGKFSLLYEGGVIEHVANVGEALKSIVALTAIGGVFIQAVPMYCYGASYYGLDPMLQKDFFEANGFETLYRTLYNRRNIRLWFLMMACRIIPQKILYRLRDKVKTVHGAKSFIFHDNPRHIKLYSPEGEAHLLPHTTHTIYVGRKLKSVPTTWPHQSIYPSQK